MEVSADHGIIPFALPNVTNSHIAVLLHHIGIVGAPNHQSSINVAEAIPVTLNRLNYQAWTVVAVRAFDTHRLLSLKIKIERLEEETKAAVQGYSASFSLRQNRGCAIFQACSESARAWFVPCLRLVPDDSGQTSVA